MTTCITTALHVPFCANETVKGVQRDRRVNDVHNILGAREKGDIASSAAILDAKVAGAEGSKGALRADASDPLAACALDVLDDGLAVGTSGEAAVVWSW